MTYRLVVIRPNDVRQLAVCQLAKLDISLDFAFVAKPLVGCVLDSRGRIHEAATTFLAEICRVSRSAAGDTVRSYGESIVAWLNFLEAVGVPLEAATEPDLQAFRTYLHAPANKKPNRSAATTNLRLAAIARFSKWGVQSAAVANPLGQWLLSITSEPNRRHFYGNRLINSGSRFFLRKEVRFPRALSAEQVKRIILELPLPYSLMVKWAVTTGIRRFELCGLTDAHLSSAYLLRENGRLAVIDINRKGGRSGQIIVDKNLLRETGWYMGVHRRTTLPGPVSSVFVSSGGAPVSKGYLSAVFASYAKRLGIDATFHSLRHTFAINALNSLERARNGGAEVNPMKSLQILMGHRSIETTSIYLSAALIVSEDVEKALGYLYGDLI